MKLKLPVILFIGLVSFNAIASESHERMYLKQMINQLEALKPLVVSASHEQPNNVRVKFHYTSYRDTNGIFHNGLLEDINEIQNGIKEKLNQKIDDPNHFQAIKGDYLDMKKIKSQSADAESEASNDK
jgi:RAQPRD family integrative conjugative element protein